MRLATVKTNRGLIVALERGGKFFDWNDVVKAPPARSLLDALPIIMERDRTIEMSTDGAVPLDVTTDDLAAPIPCPPRDIICLGKNFAAHATEFAASMNEEEVVPEHPVVFTKATTTVCGPRDTVYVDPAVTRSVDYEVELAVIIGKGGRAIPQEDAEEHIVGYTVLNDLTARDLQQRHKQWFLGKSHDGFGPMGPVMVTTEEVPNPEELVLRCWVDGELRQQAPAGQMIFNIPYVIEELSRIMTLVSGDIIAMGTPEGVGVGFKPPRFLSDGSRVIAEVDAIGRLDNTVKFLAQ